MTWLEICFREWRSLPNSNCETACRQAWLHNRWITSAIEWRRCGRVLEHLESSGQFLWSGLLYGSYASGNTWSIDPWCWILWIFSNFLQLIGLLDYYLSEGFDTWSLLGAYISWKQHLGSLEAANVSLVVMSFGVGWGVLSPFLKSGSNQDWDYLNDNTSSINVIYNTHVLMIVNGLSYCITTNVKECLLSTRFTIPATSQERPLLSTGSK